MIGKRLRPLPDLLPQPDFRRLWIAQTVSNAGSGVSAVALPLTAVLVLSATPTDMGVLGAASMAPALLLSLFVGVWVDRLPRRPLLIGADLGRALLLVVIPLAALLGVLRFEVLDVIAFLSGALTVVFDIAVTSYVPVLVEREQLVEANGQLQLGISVTRVAGPGIAGWLVQIVGAPFAIVTDALSFIASAMLLQGIRAPEARLKTQREARSVWQEIGEGLRAVWDDPILRWMVVSTTIASFGGSVLQAVYVLYVTRNLAITPAALGVILASGGLASVVGAGLAGTLGRRIGPGRAMLLGQLAVACGVVVVPFAGLQPVLASPLLVLGQLLCSGGLTVFSINQISLRQAITPPSVLGRVNATRRALVFGIIPVGSLLGGFLGTALGLSATIGVSVIIEALALITLAASPLRAARVKRVVA
jgi:predicted MFS family arabinose efflux permease